MATSSLTAFTASKLIRFNLNTQKRLAYNFCNNLPQLFSAVTHKFRRFYRSLQNDRFSIFIYFRACIRLMSSTPEAPNQKILSRTSKTQRTYHDKESEELSDLPIQFTKSDAARSAGVSDAIGLGGKYEKAPPPPIQTKSLIFSMSAFMIYFFFLREESDADLAFTMDPGTMYEKMPGLEKIHLKSTLKNYEIEGRDTTDIKKRLAELEALEAAQ